MGASLTVIQNLVKGRGRPSLLSAAAASLLILGSCAGPQTPRGTAPGSGPGEPAGGRYKIGLPYTIDGITYRPAIDYRYVETGVASWYGRQFHGRSTANGEIFDMNALSAAHRTLPLPSMVRVRNLDNGREIALRVNDRGPFASRRIIDVSRRAAQLLGFYSKGLARVRIEIMAPESRRLAAIMNRLPGPAEVARAQPPKDLAIIRDPKPVRVALVEAGPLPAARARRPAEPATEPTTASIGDPAADPGRVEKPAAAAVSDQAVLSASSEKAKRYYVQAGAFRSYGNALRLQSKLASVGEVVIVPATPETPIFRVRIGPYADAADAKGLLGAIAAKGQAGARVVSD